MVNAVAGSQMELKADQSIRARVDTGPWKEDLCYVVELTA